MLSLPSGHTIFEDLIEGSSTVVIRKAVLLSEDVYADSFLMSPSMSSVILCRHGNSASEC